MFCCVAAIALVFFNRLIDSEKDIIKITKETKKPYYKPLMVFSFLIDFGFGVIGCWWFFVFGMLKQISIFAMFFTSNQLVEKLKATKPEIVKEILASKPKKQDLKQKFKFIKQT